MSRLKICGIKSISEALSVIKFKEIDYLGVILAPSKRQVSREMAHQIANLVHENGRKVVGVFVDENSDTILDIASNIELDVVQLHITKQPELYTDLKNRLNLAQKELWLAASVDSALPKITIDNDLVLYDAKGENAGGNGISFSWELLKALKPKSYGMAGGIGAHNISAAAALKPALIDLNSKLEDARGIKSSEKIAQTLQNLKEGK